MTSVPPDTFFMKRALFLARKGQGKTRPNPMVGAVIVNQGKIVAQAYHQRAGKPHAEVLALHQAGPKARGGVLYVTLEPCVHVNKRTPPCVPLLLQSGLERVCVAMEDPNPQVRRKGIQALRRAGIDVRVGICREEARELNETYCHWMETGRPFITLKGAMTLDGKIGTHTGQSRWITGEAARQDVHRFRSQVDAILVGIGTVLKDNPTLSVRGESPDSMKRKGPQPIRVILDSRLRIPLSANVLRWTVEQPTIVCTTEDAAKDKIRQVERRGVEVWGLPKKSGLVSLPAVFKRLGQQGVSSVLIEGGSTLNAAALQAGLVDRVRLYLAPKLLGGQNAKGLIGGASPQRVDQCWRVAEMKLKRLGDDLVVTGKVVPPSRP